jgi:TRAP-type C4-dicarboxylate transport system substrate-binding protein
MTSTTSWKFRQVAVALSTVLLLAACGGDDADEPTATDEDPTEETDDVPEEPDAAGDPEVTLNLAHPFPAEHLIQVNMIEPFVEEVAEATGGTVTIEIHPAEALTAPPTAYDDAVSGAIDIGWALHGYTPGRFPLTDVVDLPFQFDGAEQATEALWTLYEEFPELQDEYSDAHVLGLWTHDLGNVYTVDQPVTEPDLSGLTLRGPGPVQLDMIEAMGGSGVGLPAPELYDSLERGVIDGLVIADTGIQSFALHEVVNYATLMSFYVSSQFLVMNQGTWDSLSEAQQQAIDAAAGREMSLVGARAYDEEREAVVQRYDEWEMEVFEVEDLGPWEDAAQTVVDDWISTQEEAGRPGQAMYDRLQEILGR